MAILKCNMCGGTLMYDRAQNLAICPYCDSKSTIYEQDRKLFEQFQDMFHALLGQEGKENLQEGFWVETSQEELLREDGEVITIEYLAKQNVDICTMYVARKHVIYVFAKEHEVYVQRYKDMVEQLEYPNPEMEKELQCYLPKLVTECRLQDGSFFLVIEKKEEVYPLRMLGTLVDRHVAWIVSRLENLCCVLNYNGIVLNALIEDNLFVDPVNHQLHLYGGWWFAGYEGSESVGASKAVLPLMEKKGEAYRNTYKADLESLRMVAIRLLGYENKEAIKDSKLLPKAFLEFLLQSPKKDAMEDFAEWDRVLEKSYGERKFIPLDITKEEIYSRAIKTEEEK